MRTLLIGCLFIVGILASQESRAFVSSPPQEETPEAVNLFYADLAPYGEWIQFEPGLYAWHPTILDPAWRPYTQGHWIWSNYGWYWVSAEPFGWATYHYGRWYLDNTYGWIWIPDAIWGPAWVEWRYNNTYVGWAPLPPYARFHVTAGIRFTRRWVAPPVYWSFVAYGHFASGHPYRNFVPESDTRRLLSTTRSAGRYQIDQNRIIDQGVERSFIEQRTSSRIGTAEVTEIPQRGVERVTTYGPQERVEIYRASPGDIRSSTSGIVARKAETRPSFDVDRNGNVPMRNSRSSQLNGQVPQRGSESQGVQMQQRSEQRDQTPEIKRNNFMRSRPQFPAPKVNRMPPRHKSEGRDKERSGRKRGGF